MRENQTLQEALVELRARILDLMLVIGDTFYPYGEPFIRTPLRRVASVIVCIVIAAGLGYWEGGVNGALSAALLCVVVYSLTQRLLRILIRD